MNQMNSFLKSVVAVITGSAAAQLIQLIASPVVARLYGPEAFGEASTIIAILGVLLPLATLGYSTLVVVAKSGDAAVAAYHLVRRVAWWFTGLLVVAIAVVWAMAPMSFGPLGGIWVAILLPIIVPIAAYREVALAALSRERRYRDVARFSVTNAFVTATLRILGGAVVPTSTMLLVAYAGGLLIQTSTNLSKTRVLAAVLNHGAKERPSASAAWTFAKKNKSYALSRAPQVFVNAASQAMPIIAASSVLGPSDAGIIAMAKTVVSAPVSLIASAVNTVAISEFSRTLRDGGRVIALYFRSTAIMAMIGLIPASLLFLFGRELFGLVFGASWAQSGEVAKWLSIVAAAQFASRPSTAVIQAFELHKWQFGHEVVFLIARAAAVLVGASTGGLIGLAIWYSVVAASSYLVLIAKAAGTVMTQADGTE